LARINFVGIDADSSNSPRADLTSLGSASGSVDADGNPFYFEGDGAAVATGVTTAINQISEDLSLFVDIDASDEDGDDGDSLQFIQRVQVNLTGEGCTDVMALADVNDDGYDDAFTTLRTGTPVCWDVLVRPNARVPATDRPQVFRASLTVYGDGSPLDRRRVFFLVPPEVQEIMIN
jgi:hypothetical protein